MIISVEAMILEKQTKLLHKPAREKLKFKTSIFTVKCCIKFYAKATVISGAVHRERAGKEILFWSETFCGCFLSSFSSRTMKNSQQLLKVRQKFYLSKYFCFTTDHFIRLVFTHNLLHERRTYGSRTSWKDRNWL